MEQDWQNELIERQNFKFETICRTVMDYGQSFFEVLAWQNYQKQGRGIISISLNTSNAEYLRINALGWKSQQSIDLSRLWEHYVLTNPLLEADIKSYYTAINTYNPIFEYVIMFTDETQLCCLTGLALWQKRENILSGLKFGEIGEDASAQWLETFNNQHIRV